MYHPQMGFVPQPQYMQEQQQQQQPQQIPAFYPPQFVPTNHPQPLTQHQQGGYNKYGQNGHYYNNNNNYSRNNNNGYRYNNNNNNNNNYPNNNTQPQDKSTPAPHNQADNNYKNNSRYYNNNNNNYHGKPQRYNTSGLYRPVQPVVDHLGRQWTSQLEKDIFSDRDAIPRVIDHYEDIPVTITGNNPPKPFECVADTGFPESMTNNLNLAGYTALTPIQKHSIAYVAARRDIIASAQTGSGKTGAFLLPIVQALLQQNSINGNHSTIITQRDPITGRNQQHVRPRALILAPTRELSIQIAKEAQKFTYKTHCKVNLVYGGVSYDIQYNSLFSQGADILVATPGRLTECCTRKDVLLSNVQYLVLDEADRMLDMGFLPQIKDIVLNYDLPAKNTPTSFAAYTTALEEWRAARAPLDEAVAVAEANLQAENTPANRQAVTAAKAAAQQIPFPLPAQRQTFMFSATFPPEVRQLAHDFLTNAITVSVGRVGSSTELITQTVHKTGRDVASKQALLLSLINDEIKQQPTLIFCQKRDTANALENFLQANRFRAAAIHGDKSQKQREAALRSFSLQHVHFLVATDVAARGLSIVPSVQYVINFDLPQNIDSYVHRIGRTGRCGARGSAISFICPQLDEGIIAELVGVMEEAKQVVPDWLQQMKPAQVSHHHNSRYNNGFNHHGYSYYGKRQQMGNQGGYRGNNNNGNHNPHNRSNNNNNGYKNGNNYNQYNNNNNNNRQPVIIINPHNQQQAQTQAQPRVQPHYAQPQQQHYQNTNNHHQGQRRYNNNHAHTNHHQQQPPQAKQ